MNMLSTYQFRLHTGKKMRHRHSSSFKALVLVTLSILALSGCDAKAQDTSTLRISAGVPFFYYQDLTVAADWYEHTLGLRKVADEGWVAIIEITPTSFIGLVNATDGTLRPTAEKNVLLSIETPDLEAWHEKLTATPGSNITQNIEIGAKGKIEEFRMQDPGGYVVEFFRWRDRPCTHAGEGKDINVISGKDACPTTEGHIHD